jgi:hypothetical protein
LTYSSTGDYGYISLDNKYLCYNKKYAIINPSVDDAQSWELSENTSIGFNIFNLQSIYASNIYTVDTISNNINWSYCNANTTINARGGLGGIPVAEGKTFASLSSISSMTCSQFADIYASDIGIHPFGNCDVPGTTSDCCYDGYPTQNTHNFFAQPNLREYLNSNCNCRVNSVTLHFCDIFPTSLMCIESGGGGTTNFDLIEKSLCKSNPLACAERTYFKRMLKCDAQDFGYGENCTAQQYCVGGTIVNASGDENCCFGPPSRTSCQSITTEDACTQFNGYVYDNTDVLLDCLFYGQFDITGSPGFSCCMGPLTRVFNFDFSSAGSTSNDSFICYRDQNNNIFGNCCYGSECANLDYLNPDRVDFSEKRVFSNGNSLHSIFTSDILQNNLIIDYVRSAQISNSTINHQHYLTFYHNASLQGYTYLELDMMFTGEVGDIYINGLNHGRLLDYSINGINPLRFHHFVIPIQSGIKNQNLASIMLDIKPHPEDIRILYDNIVLVPYVAEDFLTNTKQYYCTGGFVNWISDLDAPSTITLAADYGPYIFACDSQSSFGWTGKYCCGDDTKYLFYGEFFPDSDAGCFNATYIRNDESVAHAQGIVEDFTKSETLSEYYYKDVLFFNEQFITCQTPLDKYADTTVSYDALYNLSGANIISLNYNDSCTVRGSYYCENNAWKQYIPGYNNFTAETEEYLPNIPDVLTLKSVPPATELIKNTNFGGECPIDVCGN